MDLLSTCSWCHTMNASTQHWCTSCGHAVHVARMSCDCARCQPPVARCPRCGRPMDQANPRQVMPDPYDLVSDARIVLCTRCWKDARAEAHDLDRD